MTGPRLGIFTRVLDEGTAAERYRKAIEQILLAEELGLDTAWVAQHHFHEAEGGLAAPLVFLAHVAARTSRIGLGTGIVTLPTEDPVRLAEDAVALDLLSGGRLQLGTGSGGNPTALPAFGKQPQERRAIYDRSFAILISALRGQELAGGNRLYPAPGDLIERIWEATFSVEGGARAGRGGFGLLLSRTQPRAHDDPRSSVEIQHRIVDAYLEALPQGIAPRILASRSLVAGHDRDRLRAAALDGLRGLIDPHGGTGDWDDEALLHRHDVHVGGVEDVLASLAEDTVLARATDIAFQVHPVDPSHEDTLASIRLIAAEIGPALGWKERTA